MVRSETNLQFKEDLKKERVSLDFLEESTGFPKEFIKTELLHDEEVINLEDLRLKMLNYLEKANSEQMALNA